MNLRIYWKDTRLSHLADRSGDKFIVLNPKLVEKIWIPDIFIGMLIFGLTNILLLIMMVILSFRFIIYVHVKILMKYYSNKWSFEISIFSGCRSCQICRITSINNKTRVVKSVPRQFCSILSKVPCMFYFVFYENNEFLMKAFLMSFCKVTLSGTWEVMSNVCWT